MADGARQPRPPLARPVLLRPDAVRMRRRVLGTHAYAPLSLTQNPPNTTQINTATPSSSPSFCPRPTPARSSSGCGRTATTACCSPGRSRRPSCCCTSTGWGSSSIGRIEGVGSRLSQRPCTRTIPHALRQASAAGVLSPASKPSQAPRQAAGGGSEPSSQRRAVRVLDCLYPLFCSLLLLSSHHPHTTHT